MPPPPPLDSSDPVSYVCTCGSPHGQVLLFYRYFQNTPPLPSPPAPLTLAATHDLAAFHTTQTTQLGLTGKIRVAAEGFNVTVAGPQPAIAAYTAACLAHWSFTGLATTLATTAQQRRFFKPSAGCACVFPRGASVRICEEITPLGVSGYAPAEWGAVEELEPAEWHARLTQRRLTDEAEPGVELWDLRNHYESRIGYFVNGVGGEPAERPGIRRFSQWPRYVKVNSRSEASQKAGDEQEEKVKKQRQVLTYCTGGIRCEKATRWLAERKGEDRKICTLKGGIAAYIDWIDEEIGAGHMGAKDSLFRGANYVFDARGAITSTAAPGEPVSQCHVCNTKEDRLGKCRSVGCHIVLVVCQTCELESELRCCTSCGEMDKQQVSRRTMCACERAREQGLWGDDAKTPKTQSRRRGKGTERHE